MLNVKTWLQTTGLNVAEDRFFKTPQLPFIVFLEEKDVGGADLSNLIVKRLLTIEFYASKVDSVNEALIESMLDAKAFNYRKSRSWVQSESFFQTVYETSITERKV